MDTGSMTVAASPQASTADAGNWQLDQKTAGDVQGLVVSAYSNLPAARALFLELTSGGGAWLDAVRAIIPMTAADGPQQPAAMIAFTATGLARLGLPKEALATFLEPFLEGMLEQDRRHRLGDDNPLTQTSAIPAWSGNAHEDPNEPATRTPATVHALLMIYEATHDEVTACFNKLKPVLDAQQIAIVRDLPLDIRLDANGIAREHFGFADGISQPIPFGPNVVTKTGAAYPLDPWHGVALGEVLLGYENAHGEIPPGPVVAGPSRVGGTKQELAAGVTNLPLIDSSAGLHDLGLNGSYLVVRELKQDVAAFWTSMDREAQSLDTRAGTADVDANWLAARVVGRTLDGNMLRPNGPVPPDGDQPANDMLFFRDDRFGTGCPLGSHVRRANPRDGLAADPSQCVDLLHAANNHRILRRGRKFGPTIADPRKDDHAERGLLFMALNTDIERQFEFIQQNWLLNPNFATLFREVDPLVGPQGPMTLPRDQLRRIVDVDTYVTFTGGDYFFLPSLSALAYFATLPAPASPDAKASNLP